MNKTITKTEAAREAMTEAKQAHDNQAATVQSFIDQITQEQQQRDAAQARINNGTATGEDITTVGLAGGKLDALTAAKTNAEQALKRLKTVLDQAKITEFTERVREAHPDGVAAEIDQAREDAVTEIVKVLDKAENKITKLNGEGSRYAAELRALAEPLIHHRSEFGIQETVEGQAVGVYLGTPGMNRIHNPKNASPSIITENGYTIQSVGFDEGFREFVTLGDVLGNRADAVRCNR